MMEQPIKPMTLEELDAVSRERPLTALETMRLERAVRRTADRHERWKWSRADLLRLRAHLLAGRKPKQIAPMMKRSEESIWSIMKRLGWTVRMAQLWVINPEGVEWERGSKQYKRANCPIAPRREKKEDWGYEG